MSKIEIILFITASISLATTLKLRYDQCHKIVSKKHICVYNECPSCYEKACMDCNIVSECQRICYGDCKKCGGYKEG